MGHFRWISRALAVAAFSLGTGCGLLGTSPSDQDKTTADADAEPAESEDEGEGVTGPDMPIPDEPPDPSVSMGGSGNAPRPYRALEVATGRFHSCALLEDGRVKCWGKNDYAQLGLGDTKPRGTRASELGDALPFVDLGQGVRAKHIRAGHYATCAILVDDSVKCWGYTFLDSAAVLGTVPGETGDGLSVVTLSLENPVIDVVVGIEVQCLVLADQSLICRDYRGEPISVPAATDASLKGTVGTYLTGVAGIYSDDTVRLLTSGGLEVSEPPNIVARDTSFVASVGLNCFVRTNGNLECNNDLAPKARGLDLVQVGSTETAVICGIRKDGSIICWGQEWTHPDWFVPIESENQGEAKAVRVALDRPVVQISRMGYLHFCALDVDGHVICWNSLEYSSLGPTGRSDVDYSRLAPVDLGTYTGE